MNHFLLSFLLLVAPLNNFKGAPPTPNFSLVGTWTLTAKSTDVTPKKGGPATTYPHVIIPNTVKLTYAANGQYTVVFDKSISATGATITTAGTYSVARNIITYAVGGKTSAARIDTLTTNLLIHVATTEDVGKNYVNVTTSTYVR